MRHRIRFAAAVIAAGVVLSPMPALAQTSLNAQDIIEFSLTEREALRGVAKSQFNLGVYYERGTGVSQSYQEAAKWYRKAADQGYVHAQYNLGVLYAKGLGVPVSYEEAVVWYRKAAKQGFAQAESGLATFYRYGKGGLPLDYHQALDWYKKAAKQNDAIAQYNIGAFYIFGLGVPKDPQKGYDWTLKAAINGHSEALYNLGNLTESGTGRAVDYAQAVVWYEKAGDAGLPEGYERLGDIYHEGLAGPRDEVKSAAYFLKAADMGLARSQYMIGLKYRNGEGVAKSEAMATAYLAKSAAKGFADAQVEYGRGLELGLGLPSDPAGAADWYRKAADQNNRYGLRNLASLYARGLGVPKDLTAAAGFYQKAIDLAEAEVKKGTPNASADLHKLQLAMASQLTDRTGRMKFEDLVLADIEAQDIKMLGKPGRATVVQLAAIAWNALFAKDLDRSVAASLRARSIDPSNLNTELNLAHGLMLQGHFDEAKNIYLSHKNMPVAQANNKPWQNAVEADFSDLRAGGISAPQMEEIEIVLGLKAPPPAAAPKLLSDDELRAKAEGGDTAAQLLLGGRLVHASMMAPASERPSAEAAEREGIEWVRKAAAQGNVQAEVALAELYAGNFPTLSVKPDFAAALAFYKSAAAQDDMKAELVLAEAFDEGKIVAKDTEAGLSWYLKAAAHDDPSVWYRIGRRFDTPGDEDPKVLPQPDLAEAVKWYRKAADRGNSSAKFSLALMYLHGRGVDKDMVLAETLLTQVAESDSGAMAPLELGYLASGDDGGHADPAAAYLWLSIAAARGYDAVRTPIAKLETGMTTEQITDGKQRIADWLTAHPLEK